MDFKLVSDYQPTGDQPDAIAQLTEGILSGSKYQTLLGVTGSGKTFTMANVIEKINRPTLVISHNKTLAAQLYGEFRRFFPNNLVEYFVSYYDYYQPEAYIPVTDTYIEKDLSINEEIEKLRLSATSSLMSGRKDIIVISSVSCLYGIGNPEDFHQNVIQVERNQHLSRNGFLHKLVDSMYSRNDMEFSRGHFRVKGDTVDVFLSYNNLAYRVIFFGNEIEVIESFDPYNGNTLEKLDRILIYPANIFITNKNRLHSAVFEIRQDMEKHVEFLQAQGKEPEAKRLKERVIFDTEMILEIGYCSGIENYSRYFDGRSPGDRPFCLLDYFPENFLVVIDESHVSVPQIRAMYGGDHSRKVNLVEYGFRLPAALDNRPLMFEEFEKLIHQVVFVSATPADYELEKSEGIIADQVIRPTGLPDPDIEIRPATNQVDDLIHEITLRTKVSERVLITTLTKRMAEELTKYLMRMNIRTRYIHSDVDTLDRVEILDGLRRGDFDVLVGINLLREGLDLPEVSLVAILDADKEGFLRSERSLTQTAGRAARHINGKVIMYADKITESMQKTIDETNRRRKKQLDYNRKHNITPTQIAKSKHSLMKQISQKTKAYIEPEGIDLAAEPVIHFMNREDLQKAVDRARKVMEKAAAEQNYLEAARLRDEWMALQEMMKKK